MNALMTSLFMSRAQQRSMLLPLSVVISSVTIFILPLLSCRVFHLIGFLEIEKVIILLKSAFVATESRDKLIAVLGNIMEENIQNTSDDGISQKVVAKTGIATKANVIIEPIISLVPYRTFLEVDQPEGEFLLRLHNGPEAALFEADGGAWKIEARRNIKLCFETALADLIEQGQVVVTE